MNLKTPSKKLKSDKGALGLGRETKLVSMYSTTLTSVSLLVKWIYCAYLIGSS